VQMPAEKKIKFADYLIDTSGTLEETRTRAEAVCSLLFEDARGRRPAR
jgi:dephospho-CoA kinase